MECRNPSRSAPTFSAPRQLPSSLNGTSDLQNSITWQLVSNSSTSHHHRPIRRIGGIISKSWSHQLVYTYCTHVVHLYTIALYSEKFRGILQKEDNIYFFCTHHMDRIDWQNSNLIRFLQCIKFCNGKVMFDSDNFSVYLLPSKAFSFSIAIASKYWIYPDLNMDFESLGCGGGWIG